MKHFTMEELTRSDTARARGIDNTPLVEHRRNLIDMVDELIDPLRERWAVVCADERLGSPQLRVTSGYRSQALNEAVGGAATSAHLLGYALDLVPVNGAMRRSGTPAWVHVGYRNAAGRQRRQFLTMRGGTYIPMTA